MGPISALRRENFWIFNQKVFGRNSTVVDYSLKLLILFGPSSSTWQQGKIDAHEAHLSHEKRRYERAQVLPSAVEMQSEDVAIFWDYENCPVASAFTGYEVVKKIRCVAHNFGTVKLFKAYLELSDPATFSKSLALRSELQSSGVSLTDCPHNGRKDVADKMMLVDMLAYAIDNSAPSTIVLISGDRDFAYAVSILRLRRYRVVIVSLPGVHTSLKVQASLCLDWNNDVLGAESGAHNWPPRTRTLLRAEDRRVLQSPRELPPMGRSHAAVPLRCNRVDVDGEADIDIMDHVRIKTDGVRTFKNYATNTNTHTREHSSRENESSAPPRSLCSYQSHEDGCATSEPIPRSSSRMESAPVALYMEDASPTPTMVGKPVNGPLIHEESVPQEHLTGHSSRLPAWFFAVPRPLATPNQNSSPSSKPVTPEIRPESQGKPAPAPKISLPMAPGANPSTSSIPVEGEVAVRANTPAVSISGQSEPLVVPPIFKLLVQRLQFHRSKGFPRPFRSGIALELSTQDSTLYRRAGAERFGQYVAMAEKSGIVELGGKEGGAWIALRPEWYDAKIG
ncbi:putative NYN domain containing protein [Lyophyllum shimeji]|uniref:NYN domain containing protein n=1 Tax=Lyophyllum shimeji TaxID=47721 RepID=A0A9P3PG53_LYOSH|nr:putative NYN domain containing protein [Lyophyllum shimeji]